MLNWPELRFDSQVFLLQLLQTPAGFVEGGILLKSSKTGMRSSQEDWTHHWHDRKHPCSLQFSSQENETWTEICHQFLCTVQLLKKNIQSNNNCQKQIVIHLVPMWCRGRKTDISIKKPQEVRQCVSSVLVNVAEQWEFTPTWLASSVPTKLKIKSWIPWWTYIWNKKKKHFSLVPRSKNQHQFY